ncbi:MAG: aspartate/glutamate racemase family protein [Rubellimicrobium sp.]|nr:aspartate/glutamate racemase family protein [Rubellimicrobium sp.]
MPIYKVRPHAESYGHDIGILLIDCRTPFIPGDVGNATSYRYPVLYRTVPDVTLDRLINRGDLSLTGNVLATARGLEAVGVRAITSDCGYMLHFQKQVAAAVSIPVMLSPLLQLPFVESLLGDDAAIGIICANRQRLTPDLLAIALPNPRLPVHVAGLETCPNFRGPILDETDTLDSDAIEAEVVAAASQLCDAHPAIGAIVMECSNLPPYAHAVQAATGRPVFDFLTMIDHVRAATRRRRYAGHY